MSGERNETTALIFTTMLNIGCLCNNRFGMLDCLFDVLVRAFKASVMARNLDLGSVYTTKSLAYAQRILKINQEDP